jgi:hypothetical protein
MRLEALLEPLARTPLPLEQLRNSREVQVLEQIGTAEARTLPERLARGAAEPGSLATLERPSVGGQPLRTEGWPH